MLQIKGDLPQLLAGHFNIDLLLDQLVLRKRLENMMAAHCLSPISLREATREAETSSSCIDTIFGNVPLLKSTIENITFFDHFLISLQLKMDLEYEAMECTNRFRCLKKLENRDYSKKFSFFYHTHWEKLNRLVSLEKHTSRKLLKSLKRVTDKINHKTPREFFKYIRKMKGVVSDTKINGELSAKAFNDYFLNACEPRVPLISDYCIPSDNSQQTQSMYFSYVTDEEVCTIVKDLKNKIPSISMVMT